MPIMRHFFDDYHPGSHSLSSKLEDYYDLYQNFSLPMLHRTQLSHLVLSMGVGSMRYDILFRLLARSCFRHNFGTRTSQKPHDFPIAHGSPFGSIGSLSDSLIQQTYLTGDLAGQDILYQNRFLYLQHNILMLPPLLLLKFQKQYLMIYGYFFVFSFLSP